jgi:hypothetical protein
MNQLSKDQAFKILVDAVNVATTKGAFNLQDVSTILAAIQTLQSEIGVAMPAPETKTEE